MVKMEWWGNQPVTHSVHLKLGIALVHVRAGMQELKWLHCRTDKLDDKFDLLRTQQREISYLILMVILTLLKIS